MVEDIFEENWPAGITSVSKKEFLKLRNRLGKIECVVVTNLVSKPMDTETIVIGDQARLHLSGFALGYMGESPHGFIWLLKQLNIPFREVDIFGGQEEDTVIFSTIPGGE